MPPQCLHLGTVTLERRCPKSVQRCPSRRSDEDRVLPCQDVPRKTVDAGTKCTRSDVVEECLMTETDLTAVLLQNTGGYQPVNFLRILLIKPAAADPEFLRFAHFRGDLIACCGRNGRCLVQHSS